MDNYTFMRLWSTVIMIPILMYVVYRFYKDTKSQPKKDGRYKNLKELEEATINIEGFRFADKPREKITAYEYWGFWDINGDGDVLIRMEENPFPDQKVPFVVVPYFSQTGMAKNMLDSSNKVRFHSGQDYEFNQQIDPHSDIYLHRYPEIPQSTLIMLKRK